MTKESAVKSPRVSPITQSKAWQKLQESLGEKSFWEEGDGFSYLAVLKSTPVGQYLYLPYGPVTTKKQGITAAARSLATLARSKNVIFARIEPQDPAVIDVLSPHYKLQKSTDLSPAETWLLDLDPATLDSKLPSRLLRYHKNAEKNGLTITTSHDPADIHYLLDLQKALAKQKGISTFSEHYLKTELSQPFATLYLVHYQIEGAATDQIVAAGLVFDDATTRYNLQGAQSDEGRRLHATGILTIELIKDAAKKHLKTFDFWGIAPEGAPKTHPWAGFTAFKKTFAGREQKYAGTYDIVLRPIRYRLYQFLRRMRRLA